MPQSKEERNQQLNSFGWGVQPMMHTPMLAIFAEMNGTLLESVATAQKDWADFMHRRIKEDVAVPATDAVPLSRGHAPSVFPVPRNNVRAIQRAIHESRPAWPGYC